MTPRRFTAEQIRSARPSRQQLDPWRPYAFLSEPECGPDGAVEDVATIFLTNRECPFQCLMCDLWKNTLTKSVPVGAIPAQIDYALERLPKTRIIKLYNSGNFFDPQAIPPPDYPAIAQRLRSFQTVIVENHPRLCGPRILQLRDLLAAETELEIAMGLETVHPKVLPALNKRMTLEDFAQAAKYLRSEDIHLRTFILLRPPFLSEEAGVEWAVKGLEFAFECGVRVAAVIPTRGGNGIMEDLSAQGEFAPPRLESLEAVLDAGLALDQGRVFVDLWDIEKLIACPRCATLRIERLRTINLTRKPQAAICCDHCGT